MRTEVWRPWVAITSVCAISVGLLGVQTAAGQGGHWAYQPIQGVAPPEVRSADWVRNPIDRFVLSRLEQEGVSPSPEADRATLLRRVNLDLIGLPPTPEQVEMFLQDPREDAYARMVDRLLASPHYGERWARTWLDLCHYADSDGYLTDQHRPFAWRYRDWVVDAMNADLPFDQFTIEQLAGDLLHDPTISQQMATGLLRQTLSNREGGADLEEFRVEQVVDRTSMVGEIWLGLTVGCARCHDHKYDAVSQQEFYELYAFFDSADEVNIDAPRHGELQPYLEKKPEYDAKRQQLLAPLADEIAKLQARWEEKLLEAYRNPGRDHRWDRAWEVLGLVWGGGLGEGQLEGTQIVLLDPASRTETQKGRLLDYFLRSGGIVDPGRFNELKLGELNSQLAELTSQLPKLSRAPAMRATQNPREAYIHVRGQFRSRGETVQPQTPAVLPPLPDGSSRDRLALARWLVSAGHPLTARVTINRAWQELFGKGLVVTSGDFGVRGELPSHPGLLDYLAGELMRRDWSLKDMHRLIVTSATYRQSSTARPELDTRDPDNRLLARQRGLRLHAELVRDIALEASGQLDHRIGGPCVRPPQPASVTMEGFENKWEPSEGADRYRRGLYTFLQRTSPFAQNVTFDGPDPSRACTRRGRSNTPLQALTLLNDPVFFEAAEDLAKRIMGQPFGSTTERLDYAFLVCLGRAPRDDERDLLLEYLQAHAEGIQGDAPLAGAGATESVGGAVAGEAAAWTGVASVLLNVHEFITRE